MRHPQLKTISSNGIDGEVHFFDRPENLNRGIEYYLEMMPETTEDQITFEKVSVYTSLNGRKHNMSVFKCLNLKFHLHYDKKMLTHQGEFLITGLHRQVLIE